ncbi:amino acid aminotransferase [Rhodopirellula sp. P2]|uniref:amino acid aminotransferase n=1 Tax=Rhodopirellula sp. P2 TaxID=2127060 RepID=UPI0023689501|nr:amino acid aminotransferase [Rhodopirellula sp. P2]WDQ16544.1 aspartate/tyrosine/aromatic aminotransferase [Rhodopirellula sp. P2]
MHRFDSISVAAPDAILGLTEAFKADERDTKMNLSVGVYQDATGTTPVLRCVKEAEKRLLETESTKGYLSIDGLPDYREAARELIFGDQIAPERVAAVQTPGGTGALRVAAEFLATQCGPLRIFLPTPTWANHNAIMAAAGLPVETYSYLGSDKKTLDFDALIEDLKTKTKAGDAVLLHACCHNPTGVDPTPQQWEQIASVVAEKNLTPLLDFAYQGFGEGLEEDANGVRTVLRHVDEAIVCSSFSKNFGLYSERVGTACLVSGSADTTKAALSQLKRVVRANYSNPPRHGGAIVATVLGDEGLTQMWHGELAEMRTRIASLRQQFVDGMAATGVDQDFSFLLDQKGMFSFSGLSPMQVDQLRSEHGVYLVGSGRINVAGMNESRMEWLCNAVASVLR